MRVKIDENVDLSAHNTLGVPSRARYFCACTSLPDIQNAISWALDNKQKISILGGGSNVLLEPFIDGLVLHTKMHGIEIQGENATKNTSSDNVSVCVSAGESWHDFVRWCVQQGFCGLENLAYIPGSVGAAPVQNIGAYGVEISSYIDAVDTVDVCTGKLRRYDNSECEFAYRDSVFKSGSGQTELIYQVWFRLKTHFEPCLTYPALVEQFDSAGPKTPVEVANAVEAIRKKRLPDPSNTPNVGSFFKNPVVPISKYQQLVKKFDGVVAFDAQDGGKKLAAAWLIDYCGWKQRSINNVGVHSSQALVICNPKRRALGDILSYARAIESEISHVFGVDLEIEPQKLKQHELA